MRSCVNSAAAAAAQMCVMSGCDFLRGLSGIGVRKAHAHIRRLKSFVRVRWVCTHVK